MASGARWTWKRMSVFARRAGGPSMGVARPSLPTVDRDLAFLTLGPKDEAGRLILALVCVRRHAAAVVGGPGRARGAPLRPLPSGGRHRRAFRRVAGGLGRDGDGGVAGMVHVHRPQAGLPGPAAGTQPQPRADARRRRRRRRDRRAVSPCPWATADWPGGAGRADLAIRRHLRLDVRRFRPLRRHPRRRRPAGRLRSGRNQSGAAAHAGRGRGGGRLQTQRQRR